ncbi:MAG: hypothetical protein B7X44_00215 [Halothiobacillus sp. 15-55-196]|uniref:DUF2069 domain-containing protein n=1 Tax=Halothiobacillus sp. 15-55-196 TaxID=1970382 RepID=UPI000BCB31FC|nr:DUF2069 domain-containing protein [Halothiobacillus sp. 15-55-196]OZB37763.1 MAG: hypothetical protein B7X44_00215 [Halothiobacillus sp. 15-55-196]
MAPKRLRLLRGLIIAAQPLIILAYVGMALWGIGMARPQGAWLIVLILPALLSLPGMWLGRYRAFVWAALFDLFYLMIAMTDAWSSPHDRGFNLAIVVFSLMGFIAAWIQGIVLRRRSKRQTR